MVMLSVAGHDCAKGVGASLGWASGAGLATQVPRPQTRMQFTGHSLKYQIYQIGDLSAQNRVGLCLVSFVVSLVPAAWAGTLTP